MEKYTSDTRCKRCDHIEEWYCGEAGTMEKRTFILGMQEASKFSSVRMCAKCKKRTLHDIVSYSPSR